MTYAVVVSFCLQTEDKNGGQEQSASLCQPNMAMANLSKLAACTATAFGIGLVMVEEEMVRRLMTAGDSKQPRQESSPS